MTNITSPTSDDPVPAFTDPKRPDYSRLSGAAQSPIMREGSGYIKELADTSALSQSNAIPAGSVLVPTLAAVPSGNYRRVATLTIPIAGKAFFPYFSNGGNNTQGIAWFRLMMNNFPVTDWISFTSLVVETFIVSKPISPFAGPDTGQQVTPQPILYPPPRTARIYRVNFDKVELCAENTPTLVCAQIAIGDADITI